MDEQKPTSLKETLTSAFSIAEDTAPHSEISIRLKNAGKVTGTNLCMMTCANLIACIGLNAGSMTVCIGAMLLEPLMGGILMITYGIGTASKEEVRVAFTGFLLQILACLIASTVYFILTPVKDPTDELLMFTQVTMFDVLVAFIGGVAGMIGHTQLDRVNTIIPGVAIATALMLPLCTCGYAIAMQDLPMLLGAGYMFLVNAYFISLGASMVVVLLGIPRREDMTDEEWAAGKRVMIVNTIILIIPAILFSIHQLLN